MMVVSTWGAWWTYALIGFSCYVIGAIAGIDMVMRLHHWYDALRDESPAVKAALKSRIRQWTSFR